MTEGSDRENVLPLGRSTSTTMLPVFGWANATTSSGSDMRGHKLISYNITDLQ